MQPSRTVYSRLGSIFLLVFAALIAFPLQIHAAGPFVIEGLGKGTVPLDGPWQFHAGDDPAWAGAGVDDSTGRNGWEQLNPNAPWGTQGHANYSGYGWYRLQLEITPAPGAPADVSLLIPGIDDVYELYWNGVAMGHLGTFPPRVDPYLGVAPQTYSLGPIRSGVLAVRVFKVAFASTDDGSSGGFEGVPVAGSPEAIASLSDALQYHWLRQKQFRFFLSSLYGLASLLSFAGWLRNRKQRLLFWMAAYTIMPLFEVILDDVRLPIPSVWLVLILQTAIALREISQWFLLVYLLQLEEFPKLLRLVRRGAYIGLLAAFLDGLTAFALKFGLSDGAMQLGDAFLTAFILPLELVPILLVGYAVMQRKRLDLARWLVAIFALLSAIWYSAGNVMDQGVRFTHWTLAAKMRAVGFTLFGTPIGVQLLLRTLLFLAIVYAVVRYMLYNQRRHTNLEREFQNARELQQILVPEALPAIPGFTLTSAYRPAQEVGGDFFQIIPLEGPNQSSTLIVLGDVSGKGLQAAMTVSLIVGAIRTLAKFASQPSQILEEINQRLYGRLQGGFATCVALLVRADGTCLLASAGHPAPFLNQREVELPGALPLGIDVAATYQQVEVQLSQGDSFSLYTDGLPEARNAAGELYGFERLEVLFGTRPNATEASDKAVAFGQEDDITVLTLTRLLPGEEAHSLLSTPVLAGP